MDNAEVVRRFWDRVQARDWQGAGDLLAGDFVADWPHTRERFRGRDNYIGMNRAYPEGWRIEVGRVVSEGDLVVAEVRVPLGDQVSHVAAFYEVRDGRIARSTEYWVDQGEQRPPAWRRPYSEPPPH
jgi:ketosteroid isomerase-like protein